MGELQKIESMNQLLLVLKEDRQIHCVNSAGRYQLHRVAVLNMSLADILNDIGDGKLFYH